SSDVCSSDLHGAAQAIAVGRRAREAQETAVALTGDEHALGVEVVARLDPVEERAQVLDRVLALEPLVEGEERLAEAGRAAHVRLEDRDAERDGVVVLP